MGWACWALPPPSLTSWATAAMSLSWTPRRHKSEDKEGMGERRLFILSVVAFRALDPRVEEAVNRWRDNLRVSVLQFKEPGDLEKVWTCDIINKNDAIAQYGRTVNRLSYKFAKPFLMVITHRSTSSRARKLENIIVCWRRQFLQNFIFAPFK